MRCSEYSDGNNVLSSIDTNLDGTGLGGWGMSLPGVSVDSRLLNSEDRISVERATGFFGTAMIPAITRARVEFLGEGVVLTCDDSAEHDSHRLVFLRNTAVHNMPMAMMADFDHLVRIEYEMHVQRVLSQTSKIFAGSQSALALLVMAPGDNVVLRTYLDHTPRLKSWWTRVKPTMLLTTRTLENVDGDLRLTEQGWNPDLGDKPMKLRLTIVDALRKLGYEGALPAF